jgi:hypothetical protein
MNHKLALSLLSLTIALSACHKKAEEPVAEETAQTTSPAEIAKPETHETEANNTAMSEELKKKQALMDYGTMEDTYMNDAKAQWASTATASSTFGDEDGKTPSDSNLPINATGKINDRTWSNNNQDIGFDWIELGYEKPVNATEVRLVLQNGNAPEAISKVELQSTDGKWNTVWSGISDVKNDDRGRRTWFVKTFPSTEYQVKAVKYTMANNISHGYKNVEAAQLVGE